MKELKELDNIEPDGLDLTEEDRKAIEAQLRRLGYTAD